MSLRRIGNAIKVAKIATGSVVSQLKNYFAVSVTGGVAGVIGWAAMRMTTSPVTPIIAMKHIESQKLLTGAPGRIPSNMETSQAARSLRF